MKTIQEIKMEIETLTDQIIEIEKKISTRGVNTVFELKGVEVLHEEKIKKEGQRLALCWVMIE